jgi:lipid-binding SYLF domain-containing protein
MMKLASRLTATLLAAILGTGSLSWLAEAASAASLDGDATAALNALYKRYPSAAKLSKDAKAIVVFPKITKAGLMIGGESGNGVMRVQGKTVGYYNTSGVSYGLQVGAQTYGYALFLMTDKAVKAIGTAEGFEIGVGPSIVVMDDALAKKTTTTTAQKDIYAFIFSQKGLMAGAGIQGSKITRIKRPK